MLRCAIGVLIASVCRTVVAVEVPSFCRAPNVIDTAAVFSSGLFDSQEKTDPDTIRFEAGSADLTLGGKATLSDGVLIRRGDDFIAADDANYDAAAGELTLDGNVKYSGLASEVSGSRANFDLDAGVAEFSDSDFNLPDDRGHGSAEKLRLDQAGKIELGGVAYTSCAAGNDDWLIKAGDIEIDTVSGIGTARNMRLEFQGVPILYMPYMSFPISDERKSGVLIPAFNTSGRNGTEASVPIYWNIAPNYDATITPRVLSRRGLQLNTEARYLSTHSDALIDVRYLPDDNAFGEDRTFSTLQSTSQLRSDWQLIVDVQDVSDVQYFEDLGENQTEASTIFLNRELLLRRPGRHWNTEIAFQAYQVLDPGLLTPDRPYRRAPAIQVDGNWPRLWRGLGVDLPNELVRFERDFGVNGWRWHSEPGIYWDFDNGAFFARPEASLLYTAYRLSEVDAGVDTSPDRVLPRFSLDLGTRFEKRWQGKTRWRQTLEPRLLFTHTPFEDQSDLPVFDTVDPDFNLVQIFRKNPFVGPDRIADLDQVSLGLTSRLIDPDTGANVLTATIGQTRYFSTQGVSLDGQPPRTSESSDYIAEIDIRMSDKWNMEFGHQWNSDAANTVKSEFRLQYQPQSDRVINVGYRYREASLEQGDVSWSWPVGQRWNFVGRYNFSLRDKTTLDRFVGFEYESCCWALRLITRRYITRRDGRSDTSVSLQLELRGLTSVGDPADRRLERGILGYTDRRD
ncbi:MAG: LPS assembly protein LptD [Pseudomonadota bacterium]